jgi:RNA polymerase sigma-70 factor (ECF subfamily)
LKQNKKYKDFSDIEDLSIEDSAVDIESTMSYENLIAQIKTLSPAYRTVFNLYVIDGYSHFEISEMLGISVGASKSNLHKAKEKLKQLLEKNLGILSYAR